MHKKMQEKFNVSTEFNSFISTKSLKNNAYKLGNLG
jgi:hypothetical protein